MKNPITNRIYAKRKHGPDLISRKKLSMTRNAITLRAFLSVLRYLVEPRICLWCHYAFVSRGGGNYCSECMSQWCREYYYEFPSNRPHKAYVSFASNWARNKYGVRFDNKSKYAMIPVPDKDSPKFQAALQKTLDLMKKSAEDKVWHVNQLPRIAGLPKYKVIDER